MKQQTRFKRIHDLERSVGLHTSGYMGKDECTLLKLFYGPNYKPSDMDLVRHMHNERIKERKVKL